MTAGDWAAVAGGAGVFVAVMALIVAIVATSHASKSATAARESADESKRANELAAEANQDASRSATAAETSAAEAQRANRLAEQANERAAKAHLIATTPSNITWERTWHGSADAVSRNVLSYQNTGTDRACQVLLHVDALDLEGPRRTETSNLVMPTDCIDISLNSWTEAAYRRWDKLMSNSSAIVAVPSFRVRVTITWETEHGVSEKSVEQFTL